MNSTNTVEVAVVGAGAIATRQHIPCYFRNRYARLNAVVDTDLNKACKVAKQFDIEHFFSSVDDLLDSAKVNAISICTPPDSHSDIAIKALQRGINVLCEKPLADTVEKGLKMIEAAEGVSKILMVGFNCRFNPTYQKTKEMVNEGRVGRIYLAEYWYLRRNPLIGWSKSPWFYRRGLGGSLLDLGSHVFDTLNWFMGKPCSVYAKSIVNPYSPVDEACVATVEYMGGIGVAVVSWLANMNIEKLGIHGTGRTLYASPGFFFDVNPTELLETSLWRTATHKLIDKTKVTIFGDQLNTFQLEIDHFIDCIRKGKKPLADGRIGLTALCLTDAAFNSLKRGVEVRVRDPL